MSDFSDFISSSSSGGAAELGLPFAIVSGQLSLMINDTRTTSGAADFWAALATSSLTGHTFTRTTLASNSSYQTIYNQTSGGGALLHIICPNHSAGSYFCKITIDGVATIYQVPAFTGYPRSVFGQTYGDRYQSPYVDNRTFANYATASNDLRSLAGVRDSLTTGHYISYATSLKVELSAGSAGNWSSGSSAYSGVTTAPLIGINK